MRLRIKKRMNEDNTLGVSRKRKPQSESEEDLLMEALNNSIYASNSWGENEDYDEPEIDDDPIMDRANVSHEEHGNDGGNNVEETATVIESNPLDEDYRERDSKRNIRRILDNSDAEESQQNSIHNERNNFMDHTLYTLQNQMEQHNKLLEHLARISASMTNLMERHVAAIERRTQLMERQANANELNDFLRRRHETRKRMKKTFDWF